jgi:methionyl-tRNA formyltransferase
VLGKNIIKLGYFADGLWSHRAFELLVADSAIEIKFIVARTDSVDSTLFNFAEKYNIPFHKGIKINSDEFYDLAVAYDCDLFVSMSFNQIFRNRIISLPSLGTINCHAGKLPYYRGRNILNWALINDEPDFGITVHYVDEGLDTGDIILQKIFPICDDDDYKSLLKIAHYECSLLLYDSIKKIHSGEVKRISQDSLHPVGFYCGMRNSGDEIINWNQSSRRLFNFIRAICEPGPKAQTTLKGSMVKINKAQILENAPEYIGIVGQIVGKTERGLVVKTADSTLEIYEIDSINRIKIGDRLGT